MFQEKVVPRLLRLKQASDPDLRAAVREALTLVGYHAPVKGRGIRILSVDGGGLRYKFDSSLLEDKSVIPAAAKSPKFTTSINSINL